MRDEQVCANQGENQVYRRPYVRSPEHSILLATLVGVFLIATAANAQDFGDAPDGIDACQLDAVCDVPPSLYPTLDPTANAVPGRTGPVHMIPAPGGGNFWLGMDAPSAEAAAKQPCCDWLTPVPPGGVCDEDDVDAVLSFPFFPASFGVLTSDPIVPCGFGGFGVDGPPPVMVPGPPPPPPGFAFTATAMWTFPVEIGAGEVPGAARFANVVVDSDNSGVFGDVAGEWVLKDSPIDFVPLAVLPLTLTVSTDTFEVLGFVSTAPGPLPGDDPVVTGWSVVGFWTRFTVGPEELNCPACPFPGAAEWDGSGPVGGYDRGETEDWYALGDPGAGPPQFPDCNNNGIPDILDIALGNSLDQNFDGIPDECAPAIPTLSQWGLIVLTLLLLTAGTIVIRRYKAQAAGGPTPAGA